MDYKKENIRSKEREEFLLISLIDKLSEEDVCKPLVALKCRYSLSEMPIDPKKRTSLLYKSIKIGDSFKNDEKEYGFFKLSAKLPEGVDASHLELVFDCGAEALLLDNDGTPLKGFSSGSFKYSDGRSYICSKNHYPLQKLIKNPKKIDLYLSFSPTKLNVGGIASDRVLKSAYIGIKDDKKESLLYKLEAIHDSFSHLNGSEPSYPSFVKGLQLIQSAYFYSQDLDLCLTQADILLASLKGESSFKIKAIGNSHIDFAWLWPLEEGMQKAYRASANALYLLDKYPSFTYAFSDPCQLDYLAKYPSIIAKLKKYEQEGRLELVGGSFIGHDVNLVGEESLLRQQLYGQNAWKEYFGHASKVSYLPDSFGFVASLPDVLAHTGQNYFYTAKLMMSTSTSFPYTDFKWVGLDGSKVVSHLCTYKDAYHGNPSIDTFKEMSSNEERPNGIRDDILLYGESNSGIGPKEDQVEMIGNISGSLKEADIEPSTFSSFFASIKEKNLPSYEGELYLENHRGSYTSGGILKQYNRKLEERLYLLEAYLAERGDNIYDKNLKNIWKSLLILQSHDIITGTSSKEVFDSAKKEYERLFSVIDSIFKDASYNTYRPSYRSGVYVRNLHAYPMKKTINLKNKLLLEFDLAPMSNQRKPTIYRGVNRPFANQISTKYFNISFDGDGYISSIIDLFTGKEVLGGYGNRLRVYIDGVDPTHAAWNVADNYDDQELVLMKLEKRSFRSYGPYTEITSVYRYNKSTVVEKMMVNDDSRIITFHHDIDWKDDDRMLKSCWMMRDMPSKVRYDTQFGYSERSTKDGGPAEKAQFETPTYEWFDLSDERSGISFFNNAKNGYSAKNGKVTLTLNRSTNHPCPHSDQLPYSYEYALYVHNSPFIEANVDLEANKFNSDVLYLTKEEDANNGIYLSNDDIEMSCFKNAQSGEGLIIRLYERNGLETDASLGVPTTFKFVTLTNGLEESIGDIDPNNLHFAPFEIKTIWLH